MDLREKQYKDAAKQNLKTVGKLNLELEDIQAQISSYRKSFSYLIKRVLLRHPEKGLKEIENDIKIKKAEISGIERNSKEIINQESPKSIKDKTENLAKIGSQTQAKSGELKVMESNTAFLQKKVKTQQSWQKRRVSPVLEGEPESPKPSL